MAETEPEFERALWSTVGQIVKLYDDEPIDEEWPEGVNLGGRLHRAGTALAVWHKTRWPLTRNDDFHFAGYYAREERSAAEKFLAVMKLLDYDNANRATDFPEIRDQLDDPALLGPYFFLQRIIPLLNEKGITLQISEILDTVSPWLNQNQLLWFTDATENPGYVVLYSTDMDARLKPTEKMISLDWFTLVGALRLFFSTDFCEFIRRNGEERNHFMAVLVPYQALAENLEP